MVLVARKTSIITTTQLSKSYKWSMAGERHVKSVGLPIIVRINGLQQRCGLKQCRSHLTIIHLCTAYIIFKKM